MLCKDEYHGCLRSLNVGSDIHKAVINFTFLCSFLPSPSPISFESSLFLNDPIAFLPLSNLRMHGNETIPELDEKV